MFRSSCTGYRIFMDKKTIPQVFGMIRNRVAICDMLEAPRQSVQEETKHEIKQEAKSEENEEMRTGRHM